ncbi:hypothetical protein [Bacillus sp. FJAT-27225]|uniref:hypothetical protein n=1 Tax=Bacillus sp. FJAT-27225 TaxID=1743144 RepID=UPI000980E264|nr:hypothetical protein [Bacillus sp. FJAT-27225]
MKIPWHKRVYALYKGDDFLSEGTIREISKETGKSIYFLRYMRTPTYAKRLVKSTSRLQLIPLDDDIE